ncbi:hypothetical protein BCY88_10145 [Paraburkholderia fungorum]|uniref:Hydrogenase maturation factor n=1 Tax=Paraburkholderia fungorum TaxID=134537 RepID=A0A3R7E101_9BURK|nr:hypothetical protein BCY88_10145 [Paraburkholderia fungorum]
MSRTYRYQGFDVEVAVESRLPLERQPPTREAGYVAIVRICKAGAAVAVFSPMRFGESHGKPFPSEADALMGGFSAAQRIVDDLFHS